jgi:glycosyltransferase involved in cell wall biosynthesis
MNRFTVVIPTYDRELQLGSCLDSVIRQSVLPDEVLLIDDAALPAEFLSRWKARFSEREVVLSYHRKNHAVERRGLSESKNTALAKAAGDVLFFLDDDVVLEPEFMREIVAVWNDSSDPKLLGVGGLIKNSRHSSALERLFNRVFGLTGECAWDVNDAGFTVWNEGIERTQRAYYLHGGVCSVRRVEAAKLGFATFSGGRTALEDLDFCLTAKQKGFHFIIVPTAKVVHNHAEATREGEFLIGFKDAMNRREINRRLGLKTLKGRLWFAWASAGWALRLVPLRLPRAAGMIKGFFSR